MTQLANTHLAHGMKFDYPAGWLVTEERSGEDLTLTAADEGVAFWSVTLMPGRPDPKKVLKMALQAFEEAYQEVDISEVEDVLSGHPAEGIDIDFECLELLNQASLRSFVTEDSTFLIMYQTTDDEFPELEAVFEAINRSFRCDS
ncbi:MAG TPA: hypothetical protein VM452_17440 [Caulifigura sp.]|jgi:hypothetical protein|nr:hypothetical protein [Caulifigura sp.]